MINGTMHLVKISGDVGHVLQAIRDKVEKKESYYVIVADGSLSEIKEDYSAQYQWLTKTTEEWRILTDEGNGQTFLAFPNRDDAIRYKMMWI